MDPLMPGHHPSITRNPTFPPNNPQTRPIAPPFRRFTSYHQTHLPGPDNPLNPLESAPEHPDPEVIPRYWEHRCPNAGSARQWYHMQAATTTIVPNPGISLQPQLHLIPEGTPCNLHCGHRAHRNTELLNHRLRPVALLGGYNLIQARLERWWMRCSLCGNTWRNYLEHHPFLATAAATALVQNRKTRFGKEPGGMQGFGGLETIYEEPELEDLEAEMWSGTKTGFQRGSANLERGDENLGRGTANKNFMLAGRGGNASVDGHPQTPSLSQERRGVTHSAFAKAPRRTGPRPVATECASCGVRFSEFARPINRFGEEVDDVAGRNEKYHASARWENESTGPLSG